MENDAMKVYQVIHEYDVDGGYGDAIPEEDTVAIFDNMEDAKKFVDKYSNARVYDRPYADLSCGALIIKEIDIIAHHAADKFIESFSGDWWNRENPY